MYFEASNTEVEEKRIFQERKLKVISSEIDQEELLSCVTNEVDLGDQKDQIITVLKKKIIAIICSSVCRLKVFLKFWIHSQN